MATERTGRSREQLIDRVLEHYEVLMTRVALEHAPDLVQVDITMAQLKTLYLLSARGSLHVSGISELLHVTPSSASGLIDRLVDQGFVRREHDVADRRVVVVSLTPSGSELVDQLRELGLHRMGSLLAGLDADELEALGSVVAHLAELAASDLTAQPTCRTTTPLSTRIP